MKTYKTFLAELNTVALKAKRKETEAEKVRERQKQIKKDLRAKEAETIEHGRDEIEKARQKDFENQKRERERKRQKKEAGERARSND